MKILIPPTIIKIMEAFLSAGYSVYIVGGAVRDYLLDRAPKDYDLATDARPEDIVALAEARGWRTIDQLGRNFGVVGIVVEGEFVEVTTYRGERYGYDSHRPEQVWYADTLEEDLSRRDFTFNAMALNIEGQLFDPFDGRKAIEARVIRTVGLPEQRFAEDALRMFRACRFAAELEFELDKPLINAIPQQLSRVSGLSMERVRDEIQSILLSRRPSKGLKPLVSTGLASAECRVNLGHKPEIIPILPELSHLVDLPQNPGYHAYDVWQHTLRAVERVPRELTLRWAALLHDVAKGLPGVRGISKEGSPTDYGHDKAGSLIAGEVLRRFSYGKSFRRRVVWLVSRHMRDLGQKGDESAVWHWLRTEARSGHFRTTQQLTEAFLQLEILSLADVVATGTASSIGTPKAYSDRLVTAARQMPVGTQDLKYDVERLKAILGQRELIGDFLKNALGRVQDRVLTNEVGAIEEAAHRWLRRHEHEELTPLGGVEQNADNSEQI